MQQFKEIFIDSTILNSDGELRKKAWFIPNIISLHLDSPLPPYLTDGEEDAMVWKRNMETGALLPLINTTHNQFPFILPSNFTMPTEP